VKILHVIPSVAMRDGGPSIAIREMSTALAAAGAVVTVATTDADGPHARLLVPLEVPVRVGDVEYRHFARSMPGNWKLSIPLARWLFGNTGSFDVVHVHALFSYATIPGCRAAHRAGVPYVVRPLGTLDGWSLGQKSWKKAPYLQLIERHHLAHASAIHATSESEGDAVRALGYGEKVRVIPLGVGGAVVADQKYPRSDAAMRLLFLSRLHPKKGIPLLLGAVRKARDAGARVELVIAGGGPDAYKSELESGVRSLELADIVTFVGHVEGEDKRKLLASADVFVLPSHQENFGIAVAEALAAGLPVIVSDQVGIAPAIANAGAGRVVTVDSDALTAAIRDLAEHPEERSRMGVRAAALARDFFSWSRTAALLMELYRELQTGPVRRAS
jgi:glycosyltransferase involved in cell wall biosynthesis